MSLPRYPAYKDSGVAWLGEVPGHWGIAPFYSVASEREEPNTGMQESNLLSLSYGRIVQKDINSNDGLLPESFETYQVVRPGDIVFRLTDLQNDKRSLRTAIVEDTGIITSAYVAAKPISIEPRYLSQLLRAYDVTKVFYSMGGGLRQSMKFSDLKRLPTLLPPPEEQSAIAAFLDRETETIDALVAEQEKLIVLLKEKRQAVISHAVTKGLNPAAPMKDSGIEWLGEVPEHWEVKPVKAVASCNDEILEESTPEDYEIEYIEISGVDANRGIASTEVIPFGVAPSRARRRVSDGDVLVSTVRTYLRAIAPVSKPPENMIASTGFAVIRPRHVASHFLGYLFQAEFLISEVIAYSVGVSYPAINSSDLMRLKVPVPPSDEQTAIAAFLDRETAKLDALTAEAQRGIELLKERRSVLIAAAVTGKVDVRAFV